MFRIYTKIKMATKIMLHWFGCEVFDKAVDKTIISPLKNIGIYIMPQQSRWGAIAFIYAVAMFFISLAPTFYALYLYFTDKGQTIMTLLIVAIVCGAVGLLTAGLLATLSVYFLRNQTGDKSLQELQGIRKAIKKLADGLKQRS
jgi:hypothetical protein